MKTCVPSKATQYRCARYTELIGALENRLVYPEVLCREDDSGKNMNSVSRLNRSVYPEVWYRSDSVQRETTVTSSMIVISLSSTLTASKQTGMVQQKSPMHSWQWFAQASKNVFSNPSVKNTKRHSFHHGVRLL